MMNKLCQEVCKEKFLSYILVKKDTFISQVFEYTGH